MTYGLLVVGASLGGLRAMSELLDVLPDEVDVPVVLAQHRAPDAERESLEALLRQHTRRSVVEAGDKDAIRPQHVYVAPPDYHLLVEADGSFALSTDERVQYARPSVDVLFESAADAYGERTIGIVLTGANADGAAGLLAIRDVGGVAVVQDPETAEARQMPDAAIYATAADAILPVGEMGKFLLGLCVQ
jgi:two-component system, chemotaxis family, protein-glutamate methylesterase/glutaminase